MFRNFWNLVNFYNYFVRCSYKLKLFSIQLSDNKVKSLEALFIVNEQQFRTFLKPNLSIWRQVWKKNHANDIVKNLGPSHHLLFRNSISFPFEIRSYLPQKKWERGEEGFPHNAKNHRSNTNNRPLHLNLTNQTITKPQHPSNIKTKKGKRKKEYWAKKCAKRGRRKTTHAGLKIPSHTFPPPRANLAAAPVYAARRNVTTET